MTWPARSIAVVTLAALAALAATKPPICPEIRHTAGTTRVDLPPAFSNAISRAVPGFRALTIRDYADDVGRTYRFSRSQAPWAVVGDFDADGFCDLVIDGRSRSDSYRLV